MKWFIKLTIIRTFFGALIRIPVLILKKLGEWGARGHSTMRSAWFGTLKKLGNWITRTYLSIRSTWLGISKFRRNFISNFFFGIAIALLLHFFHHTNWVSQTEDVAMDSMMFVNQGTARMRGDESAEQPLLFTFIDIDENSYRTWDEPAQTPRDKLLKLIKYASQKSAAKAIVLDIDLSYSSNKDNDEALLNFLEGYDKNFPPLFLIRDFYPKSKFTEGSAYQIRPSILDQVTLGENVFQAHPVFKHSFYDKQVRYWQLLATGCLNDQPVVIPAFQLLVDAFLNSPEDLDVVVHQLQKLTPANCDQIEQETHELSGELVYGDKAISLDSGLHQRIGERIIYTLPWTGTSLPSNELLVKPAHRLTEASNTPSISAVAGRVVVIGGSFSSSHDFHQTPLGEMPGAVIILNAIKSLHLFDQIKPPSVIVKLLLLFVLILLMSWAFARFSSLIGSVVTTAVIMILLMPLSFYFFKYGLWIDFAVPVMGMQFLQVIDEFLEGRALRKQLKKQNTLGEDNEK